jgi:hypothetical protein
LFPFTDDETKRHIASGASNPVLALIIVVSFGYLIGILLRLFRPDLPDKWSAIWVRRFIRSCRQENGEFVLWATEDFPYIGWIGEACKQYLPSETQAFHAKIWADRKQVGYNKQFFNYCKVLVNSSDERSANEIYVAESLTRYIAGMFYALLISFVLILIAIIFCYFVSGQIVPGLVIALVAYLSAILVIVRYFRGIRVKEVETVFLASFKNRDVFFEDSDLPHSPQNEPKDSNNQ